MPIVICCAASTIRRKESRLVAILLMLCGTISVAVRIDHGLHHLRAIVLRDFVSFDDCEMCVIMEGYEAIAEKSYVRFLLDGINVSFCLLLK